MVALSGVVSCLDSGNKLSESASARFVTLPLAERLEQTAAQSVQFKNRQEEDDSGRLIKKIADGEREALSELFKRFSRPVRNIGWRILRNSAEADDLVQEVFLYIYRKGALFDGSKGSARSWIFQIAYTQAFIRRRLLNSRVLRVSGIADNLHESEPRTNSGAQYDQSVEGLFGRSGWQRVLEILTEEQRKTLRLHFFEGYTFGEIAEKLGESYANIRNHHYRGLEKLRKSLTENILNKR